MATYSYRGVRIVTSKRKAGWTYTRKYASGLVALSSKPFKTEASALSAAASAVDRQIKSSPVQRLPVPVKRRRRSKSKHTKSKRK